MEKTYLAIVAVLVLATAAALTPVAISQQVFAQDTESETETENKAKTNVLSAAFPAVLKMLTVH